MTPERKAYLMEHIGREATIRHLIRWYKYELKKYKAVCNSYDLKRIGRKPFGYRVHIVRVNETKLIINTLRHELNRLKGMDRVVVPNRSQKLIYRIGEEFKVSKVGFCNCKANLTEVLHVYCPDCGRKILWDKVL